MPEAPPNHSKVAFESRDVRTSGASKPPWVRVTAHAATRARDRFGLTEQEVRREVLDAFAAGLVQRSRPRELGDSRMPTRRRYAFARTADRSRVHLLAVNGAKVFVLTVLHGVTPRVRS